MLTQKNVKVMTGLFRIILISMLIWYVVKFIFRLLYPSNTAKYNTHKQTQKEGNVTIHHDKQHQQQFEQKAKKGEYVDYEEIE